MPSKAVESPSASLPDFANRQAAAYDRLLSVYQAQHGLCRDIRRTVMDRVMVGLQEGDTALDVGCGAGAYLALMAERGLQAEGIDLSPEMTRAAQDQSGCPVSCADFRTVTLAKHFDLVFAQALVHLFPKGEVIAIIEKLKSLATKRVYFSTSIAREPSEGWEDKEGTLRYRSRYTILEFADVIAQSTADGLWRATTFELTDPDRKRWIQVLLDRQ